MKVIQVHFEKLKPFLNAKSQSKSEKWVLVIELEGQTL